MNDQLDTAVRGALRDIVAAAPTAERLPAPVKIVSKVSARPRRRVYLAVAATFVTGAGVAGILAIDTKRSGPDTSRPGSNTSQPAPDASQFPPDTTRAYSTGRPNGAITDPRAINLAPWLTDAPAWPGLYQPDYVIFDIAALAGWTKVDETGSHLFDDGSSYSWEANVNDPEGRQFHLVVSNSVRYPRVVSGDAVDINGASGIAAEGELSWPLDATHIATVTELGTADTERSVALALELTTTTVSTISIGGLGTAPEIHADPMAPFGGVVEGVAWTASATPGSITFIMDQTESQTYSSDIQPIAKSATQIIQVGGNDLCVFIGGFLPDGDVVRLVLSDDTSIILPTHQLEDGDWFAACVPYALDAIAVGVGSSGQELVLHQLNWPLLRPTLGQRATGGASGVSRAFAIMSDADLGSACGAPDFNQMAMVASGLRADGNMLELWVAPTSTGEGVIVLLGLRHNGDPMGATSTCNGKLEANYASATTDIADGETVGIVDIYGRTDASATQVRVTFASGKVVEAYVQTDGYFVMSLLDTVYSYTDVKSVEPID